MTQCSDELGKEVGVCKGRYVVGISLGDAHACPPAPSNADRLGLRSGEVSLHQLDSIPVSPPTLPLYEELLLDLVRGVSRHAAQRTTPHDSRQTS